MLLIDSLYVNNSGGFRLLEFLIRRLCEDEISFFLLADIRCSDRFYYCRHVRYMKPSLFRRKRFYQKYYKEYSSVFCFGNIPSPIKLKIPVYTYFHNINLLTLSETHSLKDKLVMWLKREIFRHYKINTDYWLIQTPNTQKELCEHLGESVERTKLLPFFDLPSELYKLKSVKHGDDYVFVSNYTGAKGHEELLEAWRILHRQGVDKTLHLTVPGYCTQFISKINEARAEGVSVVNHGLIPFGQVLDLYRQSKAIIYPSHNESLGLGLVEAIEAGCDVIASDLPFTYSVCKPSLAFNPYSTDSIVNAIIVYEQGSCPTSELRISNQIDELVNLLKENQ